MKAHFPARSRAGLGHRAAEGKFSLKFFFFFVLLLLLRCLQVTPCSAAARGVILRGFYGTSSKTLHNAGPPLEGEMAPGALIGGGFGFTLGDYWRLGLMGDSIARRGDAIEDLFTAVALTVWTERHFVRLGRWSVAGQLEAGAVLAKKNGGAQYEDPWDNELTQLGLLLQPGLTLKWHASGPLECFGTFGYRWTSVRNPTDRFGRSLVIDEQLVEVDLNGPVVFAGVSLTVPWTGPILHPCEEGGAP